MNIKERILPYPRSINLLGGELSVKPQSGVAAGEWFPLLNHIFKSYFVKGNNGEAAVVTLAIDDKLISGGYRIIIKDKIEVFGADTNGIASALWTLEALGECKDNALSFPCCTIEDSPYKEFRGVHFYLPPSYGIDEFCRILDAISSLKYNAIILETGGAVEFDSHPEVNAAWRKFCREAREYPGGPQGLQGSEAYWKDSTHVEMANSDCLTKAELKRIADHCALLGLELIPEIQALSHAYYLTLAHREISERPYERWPDTYCPSCEESYTLYFDLAEELLELLKPKRVSIGHDEVRVLGECPKCRNKSGHTLLAEDVNRLYSFYEERGVGVMMWGEKLQPRGGAEIPKRIDKYGRKYSMPATYEAADMISKDILMLDWQYMTEPDTEVFFGKKGFNEIFGNFCGSTVADWERRSSAPNVLGAEVSTWCVPMEYEVGYNGWFDEFVYSSLLLWYPDYTDAKRDEFRQLTNAYMPKLKERISGKGNFNGALDSLAELSVENIVDSADIQYTGGTVDEDTAAALLKGGLKGGSTFTLNGEADTLVFFHAADPMPQRRTMSWAFLDRGARIPARYAVDFEDGMCVTFDAELGMNLGAFVSDDSVIRPTMKNLSIAEIDDLEAGSDEVLAPAYENVDAWRGAALYFTRYAEFKTCEGARTVYAYEWKNPYPGHKVVSVRMISEPKKNLGVQLFAVGRTV